MAKVSDQEILNGLMSVFRSKGYDGASLNELAEATGLKKASLYHRFPGGKKEMTDAVLDFMEAWVNEKVFKVLSNSEVPPQQRLKDALYNIGEVYGHGTKVCLYRSLSMDTGMSLFGTKIEKGIAQWLESFSILGQAVGKDAETAEQLAKQSFVEVQGSLVLSKAMGSTEPFAQAIENIESRYTT
ncbi:TetR/AcrR family transcriptional regulator [Flagellimonas myxillae]|uniref:TetR/AcrR family transcriptional regulator n=1 Tax=Flagellimonas myxillae TaxID=2942214 RepID=UPI00201F001D|nr:TetR/AcrR family transcriptional regulator [Muricauda myxillae]MCL6267814.1 TetR/AcrR family transcriptional regulator [Muricauda myxillae]